MNPNQRMPSETLKEYRERQRREKAAAKAGRTRLLWNSERDGTYIRAKHGPLGK